MCGRYTLTQITGVDDMFKVVMDDARSRPWTKLFNIAPTEDAPIVIVEDGRRALVPASFGLIPAWAKDVKIGYSTINARAETIADKPAFRGAFRSRRCLVPADGYFEWEAVGKTKLPWRMTMADERPFAFAGLWESRPGRTGGEFLSFSIITTVNNSLVADISDRMPAILPPADQETWLKEPRLDLLRPYPSDGMKRFRVSPAMNKATVKGPECVQPI